MNAFLSHIDMAPLFYGVVLALGIFSMLYKFMRGDYVALFVEAGVFILVFKLHGGTLTGGLSAAVCSLIVSLFYKSFVRRVRR